MRKMFSAVVILILLFSSLICFSSGIQPVNAQQATAFSDDFSTDSHAWEYFGSAYRDVENKCIVLTADGMEQGGVAFFKTPIQGSFTASFRYKANGGYYNSDGFIVFFYKEKYTNPDFGGSEGFSTRDGNILATVPGYGIEFDGWQNAPMDFNQLDFPQNPPGDPSDCHIALLQTFVSNHLKWVDDPRVDDSQWHQVTIAVEDSTVSVSVDHAQVLQWTGDLNRTYDGFGFSAGSGRPSSDNWHLIDDVSINAQNMQISTPTLTASCKTSVSESSFKVQISGALTIDGTAIPNAPVQLSYSVTGGDSWQDLTLVHTGSDGSYSALWLLPVTGDYMLKAVYKGNGGYSAVATTVNFAMAPGDTQNVFSVTSNSTLSALSFDSSKKTLNFTVSGDSGTVGYLNVYIPKTLMNDTSGLAVFLDNNQIASDVQSQGDCWLLTCTYHHSTHKVTVSLATAPQSVGYLEKYMIYIVAGAIAVIALILAVAFRAARKNMETPKNP